MAKSQAQSESSVSTTTNTVTDSYNQAFSRIENLSDVGNVSILQGEGAGGGPSISLVLILIGGLIGAMFLFKKR